MSALRAVSADVRLFDLRRHPATVRYVSPSVVSLSSRQNNWLTLCDASLGGGPGTILLEAGSGLGGILSVGDSVSIDGSCMSAPAGEIVTWEGARRWTPQPPLGVGTGVGHRVTIAGEIVGALGHFMARPLISEPVRALRVGCREPSAPRIRRAVTELVGLGPGLTPAGDDYLGGYLAALLHISAGNRHAGTARAFVSDAIGAAPGRTQPLSEFLLGEYRAGMIPEFLSACVKALLHPSNPQRLSCCVRRVLTHGATSGTEMMLGLLDASRDFCLEPDS